MSNSSENEGSRAAPPAAWLWSQYRGVQKTTPTPEPARAPAPAVDIGAKAAVRENRPEGPMSARQPAKQSSVIAFLVALIILTAAGATWWISSSQTPTVSRDAIPSEAPAAPAPSEAAPPPAAPAAAAPPTAGPAAAAPEQGARPAPEKQTPARKRKKRHAG